MRGRALDVDRREWPIYQVRLGRQLRDLRLERDITLKRLADKVGITDVAVHNIETAKRSPSISTLFRLARGLGVSMQEILP